MNKLQLIKSESFGDIQCDIYSNGEELYMTREQIGRALEYADPQKAMDNMHNRFRKRLNDPKFSVPLKLRATDGKSYETTVYTRKGVMEICRHSNQPKADQFMDWVWDIMDALITGKAIINDKPDIKLQALSDRAQAMLINAQTRKFKAIMSITDGKNLSATALEVFGLKALENAMGIDVDQMLPECVRTCSAAEIAKQLGILTNKIGVLAYAYRVENRGLRRYRRRQVASRWHESP